MVPAGSRRCFLATWSGASRRFATVAHRSGDFGITTDRDGRMLVLARKKHEAILIDGVIRIEVVSVAKATVRVRLRTPRNLSPPSHPGPGCKPGEGQEPETSTRRKGPVAMDDYHMTLVNQQVIALGERIRLGVVDADKTRALFFVDAPAGMSITALKPQDDDRPGSSAQQNLLQFMGQAEEPAEADRPRPSEPPQAPEHVDGATSTENGIGPELIPFPPRLPKRHRL